MKKEKQLSPKIERQIKIISKYYDIDYENRVINLSLHYNSVDDLFETDFVGKGTPVFKDAVLQRISDIITLFPDEFRADIKLFIDDYKGYEPEKVFESFQDSLEMFHYQVHKEKSFRWIEAVVLALISVGILFVRKLGLNNSFINDSMLITEMLDITAWVFLWQGVTVLFLNSDTVNEISFNIIRKLKSVTFLDKKKKALVFADQETIEKDWIQVSKKENVSKKMLIISGAISFATGVTSVADTVQSLFTEGIFSTVLSSIVVIVAFTSSVLAILGGIGAISLFREKGPFQKMVPVLAIVYLLSDIILLGASIALMAGTSLSLKDIISFIVSLVLSMGASVLYFISYILLRRSKKQDRIKYSKKKAQVEAE